MRKIDHNKAYSDDDIWFIRQAGFPNAEEMITRNAEQYGGDVPEVPEGDSPTLPVIGDEAGQSQFQQPDEATGAVRLVDPTKSETGDVESDDYDYDSWTKTDLEAEVSARNDLADTSDVVVEGTGANGSVKKEDLIKGLRLWDIDNPDALKD